MIKCPICDKSKYIDLKSPVVDGVTGFTFCGDCYSDTKINYQRGLDSFINWLEAIILTRKVAK